MFCFVDFRNRPQYQYTFSTREKAREYLRKIKNNSLGVTVVYADGRREYFENGLPSSASIKSRTGKSAQHKILRGCHVKYKICPLANMDSAAPKERKTKGPNITNWKSRQASSLFMLGNLKFSMSLLFISAIALSSTFFLQRNYGRAAEEPMVLGATDDRSSDSIDSFSGTFNDSFQIADEDMIMGLLAKIDDAKEEDFRTEIMEYVKGRPMEDMVPYIAKQPRTVAAFLVGIAMKESKFGVYAPHDANGQDCHNYWGYRGSENTTASGYSCFTTPEQAIAAVGNRIGKLVDSGLTNPSEMVIWKCGASCSWDNPENVRKWIADVGVNFYRINNAKENS
ncbi:MAG: hypothetical protein PHF35_04085 [Candidatus Moranbacteria bacterium]|nr:hypothetical protein [Candidatus Moranbacteria bacterium]